MCEFAVSQPQAVYCAYTKGYQSKFTHFIRTIEHFEKYLEPVDTLIADKLIPTLFGTHNLDVHRSNVTSLKTSDGGLGISKLSIEAKDQYSASRIVTGLHVHSIMQQENEMRRTDEQGRSANDLKSESVSQKREAQRSRKDEILRTIPDSLRPYIEQAQDKGASAWLSAIPLREQQLDLNKEEFRDALRIRYNMRLEDLPSKCVCGENFDLDHALICKKGGFISARHNNLRDFFTSLIDKVCVDVEAEPSLIPLENEHLTLRSANVQDDARLDMKARGFWRSGQTAFFDIRVTHVNSLSNKNRNTTQTFRSHENAKK